MMSRNTISKVRILSLILALAMIFLTPMTMAANPQDPPPAPLEAVSDALEPEHAAGEPEALPAEELSEESTFLGEEETSSEPAESFTLPSEPETAWETAGPCRGDRNGNSMGSRGGTARCLGGRNNRSSFDCPHGLEPRILD